MSVVAFFAPFVVGLACWLTMSGPGLAQSMGGGDSSQLLQTLGGRNGSGGLGGLLGGFNNGGIVDTTSQLPQSQTLQPQNSTAPVRLPPSRLEQIMSARANVRLMQFGYDQLGVGRAVTVPETGAVADDYVLGPGDEIAVSLRGQENSDFRTTVGRDGNVVLPRLKPIFASGRTFGSFRQDVDAAVHRAYVASAATTSIGRVRQVNVLVAGEVNSPGPRIVTGLSSALDALLLSGGVKKTGSLRNVRVERGGHVYTIDLYGALTGTGGGSSSMRLADGDRLVVPPLGSTVAVAGLVRRPGIYELPGHVRDMTARALLNLAGGEEVRGRYRLSVLRIEPDGRSNLVLLPSDSGVVRDSEILRVELAADYTSSQATLSGGTGLAGQYAVPSGGRLSDILRAPGALGPAPYTLFGILVRKDPRTLLRSLVAFTPVAVMNGTEDVQLQSDDMVRPISINESQLLAFVVKSYLDKMALDQNNIRNPLQASGDAAALAAIAATKGTSGSTPDQTKPQVTPSNPFGLDPAVLQQASSGQEDFSGVPADIQRANITALLETAQPGSLLATQRELAYQRALTQAAQPSVPGVPPSGSQLQQSQQTALLMSNQLGAQGGGEFSGGLNQTGGLQNGLGQSQNQNGMNGQGNQQQEPAANYMEQPSSSAGYASNQEVHTFGELSRQLGVDPLVLVNFLIDHRARLDGAVNGPGPYFVGPNATLNDLVQAAGGTASWADESGVELLTTAVDGRSGRAASQRQTLPLRQGTLASYIVRPHDQVHFNQVFTDSGIGSVSVQGEVRFGGNYPITRGEHLSDLLMRVGGLTSTAYPAGTVFLRKSAAQVEEQGYRRAADEIQSQLIAGIARIGNDKITGEGYTAIQGFITQLRTQKGLGRIAMSADPSVLAANPQRDPLLEAGDVIFIPQRPSTVTVLGEVMQPGSYSYQPGMTVADYIKKAGGYAQFSDEDLTFVVQPDGSARKIETSWLGFDAATLPPGSAIVVPRDLAPLTARQVVLDVTGIFSSLAVTLASLAVLAKQ